MADTFKGIITADGKKRQLPYESVLETPVSDETLSIQGGFADAKVVGNNFKKAKAETDSLKEDLDNLSSSKISKFYATNNGENHLADSDNGKIADMMVYGKSEQKKYHGYQLLEHNTAEYNFTATTSYHELVNNAFENIKSGTYYLRRLEDAPTVLITFLSESKETVKQEYLTNNSEKQIMLEKDVAYVKYIIQNLTFGTTYKGTVKLILASTSGADYEPYVGGIPSPNPDYPQEIKSVVNPTIKVCGKNLFDSSKISNYAGGLTCKKNSDGSITVTGSSKAQVQFVYKTIFTAGTYFISFKSVGKAASGNNISPYVMYREDGNTKYPVNKFTLKQDTEVTIGMYFYNAVTDANQTAWLQIEKGSVATPYEPYKEQSIQLPYTLNAIPVSSGGNVTIGGQQYIADYVDVERGKLVRLCKEIDLSTLNWVKDEEAGFYRANRIGDMIVPTNNLQRASMIAKEYTVFSWDSIEKTDVGIAVNSNAGNMILSNQLHEVPKGKMIYLLINQEETDLTPEEIAAFKTLAAYYPVTNISVNSEQLDGYTVFNYPISMANGWNYVKQQLNDNRDYIYDMDIQSAEAYVNSEYAVALTELEV